MKAEKLHTPDRYLWWLHFNEIPPQLNGEADYMFGTKAAIFEMFDKEDIGVTLLYLQNKSGEVYNNKKITLRRVPFFVKPTKRGNAKRD